MTKLYLITSDSDLGKRREFVQFEDYEPVCSLVGRPVGPHWVSPMARLVRWDRRHLAPADFPWVVVSRVLVSKGTALPLAEAYRAQVELVPLRVAADTPPLWLWNVLSRPTDLLDEPASDIARIPSGLAIDVRRYAFHADAARRVRIAQLPTRLGGIFVGEEFIASYRRLELTGLAFKEIWVSNDE